ncbi:MAG: NAD(P)-dependent oxidoreductase [Candidatus Woesebacteria bacterium]
MKESRIGIGENEIPESLPLLDFVDRRFGLAQKQPFRGRKILAVQHLLGASIPLFSLLEKGGAKPEDVYVVGKAYSSHPEVVRRLIASGYNLSFDDVFSFDQSVPYDSLLESHIVQMCSQMLEDGDFSRGLIIDDGGKAIKLVHEEHPELLTVCSSVEQTSRGARLLSSIPLSLPVINVARSEAKTIHESPSIAEAMVSEFMISLSRWQEAGVYSLSKKEVLVLGFGFIGEGVVSRLQKLGFSVSVFDPDESRMAKVASIPGVRAEFDRVSAYSHANVIIGCSGTPSIPPIEFQAIQPNTLLVNMASTDLEFSAWNLRKTEDIVHQQVLPSDTRYLQQFSPMPWRSLYHVRENGTHFYLANGGFPSDFSGKINPVPAAEIQLTAALLLGAAVQAVDTQKTGLVDLDLAMQTAVINEYLRIQAR